MKKQQDIETEFLAYINRYKPLIIKVSSMYAENVAERQDLIQEITIQLWTSFKKMDKGKSETAWTNRVALNTCIKYTRKKLNRKKREKIFAEQNALIVYDRTIDENLEQMRSIIEHLKPIEKALIILHLEGKRNIEISEIMGISTSNVSTRINRIKNKIINNLNHKS